MENIFESRYKHVGELCRLGANIKVEGRVAIVEGVPRLFGASVEAPDLRGGAALIVAGLAADGLTEVSGLRHVDRGYEAIAKKPEPNRSEGQQNLKDVEHGHERTKSE